MSDSTSRRSLKMLVPRNVVRQSIATATLALGALGCSAPAPPTPPTVVADGVSLQGELVGDGSTAAVFRGIPYAAPPIGSLRWREPAPIMPRQGVQQATDFTPACIQGGNTASFYGYIAETLGHDPALVPELGPISEDCLYLNVWTPNPGGKELVPVMVWIHGGANVAGTAAAAQTDGTNLARQGVVVVTLNYRLNVFGFFAHPALTAESEHASSGNYALLDQIAALRWVERNIASFGGDPDRVTVFGESAGATDIAYLLASPVADGLFDRAVIESGGFAVSEYRTLEKVEVAGERFAEAVGAAGSGDVLANLRAIPAEALHHSWLTTRPVTFNAPNVDGWVLPEVTARTFDRGEQIHVPLIIGFNTDEWTTLRHYWPNVTLDGFRQVLRAVYGPLVERAMELYPATTDEEAVAAADRWQIDWYFACPSRFIADRMERAGVPIYFYMFDRAVQAPGGELLGAYHGAEIPYVWNTLAAETWVPRQPYDQELADTMSSTWVRFAGTGDPNGGDLPPWPLYDSVDQGFLRFGDTVDAGSGVRSDACDLYEALQEVWLGDGR